MSFDGVRYAVRTPSYAVRLTAYGTAYGPYGTPCDDGVPAYDVPRRGSYTVRRRPGLEGKERKLQKDVDGTRWWGILHPLPLTATTTQILHPMNAFSKIKFVTITDSSIEDCCVEAWTWDEPASVAANASPDRKSLGYGKTVAEAKAAATKAAHDDLAAFMRDA